MIQRFYLNGMFIVAIKIGRFKLVVWPRWALLRRRTPLPHDHNRYLGLGWTLEFSTANESSARTTHRWQCDCGQIWSDTTPWDPPLGVMARQAARSDGS